MKRNTLTMAVLAGLAGLAAMNIRNEGTAVTIEQLQDRLTELHQSAVNIQARADAESRPLTDEEVGEIDQISNAFEGVEAEIERRSRLLEMNARVKPPGSGAGAARRTNADDAPPQNAAAGDGSRAAPKTRIFAEPRNAEPGKWGFRSAGEFFNAVRLSSRQGSPVDPRLIANAAPTTGSEGTGADGGFAVPPDFRSAIMIKVMGEDSLLTRTDQQTSSSNSFTFPKDETTPWQSTGGVQAYWEGEASQFQQSKPALLECTTKLNKLIALVPLTDELMDDAPSMANYVNRKAPDKMTFKINDAIIRGTGAGQPLGVLNSAATVSVAKQSGQAAGSIVFQNIIAMWTRMYAPLRRNAVWAINPDAEQQIMQLAFPNQGSGTVVPVYLPPNGLSESPYATLLGRPVIPLQSCSALGTAGDIIFGDFNQYLSIVKTGGIRSDVSIHLWFDYDITAFRFIIRVGGQPWYTSAITQANSSNPRGAFITLAAR